MLVESNHLAPKGRVLQTRGPAMCHNIQVRHTVRHRPLRARPLASRIIMVLLCSHAKACMTRIDRCGWVVICHPRAGSGSRTHNFCLEGIYVAIDTIPASTVSPGVKPSEGGFPQEQMAGVGPAVPSWQDGVLPLHHICMAGNFSVSFRRDRVSRCCPVTRQLLRHTGESGLRWVSCPNPLTFNQESCRSR